MDIVQMLLTISSWHPMTIWISSISIGFTAVVFIGIPLIRRTKSKRRLKKILKTYSAEAVISCIDYSRLSYVGGSMPTSTLMYLIANNEMLVLTVAMDSSYVIEIPFEKMVHYTFNGTDLIIKLDNSDTLDVDFEVTENRDKAFNRYALKHANIIDYIAARVPKKQVHVRL